MKNKLNIVELLKNCPKGMELDCALFENLEFDHIDKGNGSYPIICRVKTEWGSYNIHTFTEYGCYNTEKYSKCVIFPKGKTTWEGFVPPCKFKDGDIITCTNSSCTFVAIYQHLYNKESFYRYVCLILNERMSFSPDNAYSDFANPRLATEEEKQKLFNAIKANGYKWNPETKTLEKLTKFKVGDRIKEKKAYISGIITDISDGTYKVEFKGGGVAYANIAFQDEWELVPNKFDVTTLKPFESKVLVRSSNDDMWKPAIWGIYNDIYCSAYPYITTYGAVCQCIPYESNKYLLGTTDNCDEYYKTWE